MTLHVTDPERGPAIVAYWRDMLAKDPSHTPSCDHDGGLAVIAYIDSHIAAVAEAEAETERLRETLAFNRDITERHERDRTRLTVQVLKLEAQLAMKVTP